MAGRLVFVPIKDGIFQSGINLPKAHSFFLFGVRGAGKTTLLHRLFSEETTVFVNLLELEQETGFIRDPERFGRLIDWRMMSLCVKYLW